MSEFPHFDDYEEEPQHRHGYRPDISDWWCYDCDTVTDFCKQLNDFSQDVPQSTEDD